MITSVSATQLSGFVLLVIPQEPGLRLCCHRCRSAQSQMLHKDLKLDKETQVGFESRREHLPILHHFKTL